ncbi:hypothetical protein BSL78_08265 [Apostichopus japonicus]|uniref:B box-type domain-containing protein n=1 Tax=Stichopus japonicus TaxID=307972 RepID=A0A2G8L3J8_STIJA|nr:hypothetical protein BSL78_08265 [Apostichopus japonicus]
MEDYRCALADAAKELTEDEIQKMSFKLDIPRSDRSKIKSGVQLVDRKIGFVTCDNVDKFLKLLADGQNMVAHGKLLDYKKTYLSDDNNHAPHASKDVSDSHRDVSSDPIDSPDIPEDPVKRCQKHPKYEMDKCCVKCAVVTCVECALNDHKVQPCDVIPLEDIPKILKTQQGHVDDAWQSFVQLRDSVTNMYKEQKQLQDNV